MYIIMSIFRSCILLVMMLLSISTYAATPLIGPFTTNNGQITDKNQQTITLQGVSWFGFNTNEHILHGLWTADFTTMLKQIKSLGFNAVRIPFQFDFVINQSIKPANMTKYCHGTPCNTDIPRDSALRALQWVVQQFTSNGIYVLLDDHYEDDTYVKNPAAWLNGWKTIAQLFRDNPLVGYDIYNEPDAHQITWQGNQSSAPAWGPSLLTAMDAIHAIDPDKLFFIEGTAQGALESNWGNGFATDDQTIAKQISNPKIFFTQLQDKPYINQVVISPHVYGPDGTNGMGPDESDRTHAFQIWARLFGYLQYNFLKINNTDRSGFCTADNCHRFPIAIGEFGGKFDASDPQYKKDTATQINLTAFINQLQHDKPSWFYWDWNPNSGNTGGILKNDWQTIDCNKINFLVRQLGLKPDSELCTSTY